MLPRCWSAPYSTRLSHASLKDAFLARAHPLSRGSSRVLWALWGLQSGPWLHSVWCLLTAGVERGGEVGKEGCLQGLRLLWAWWNGAEWQALSSKPAAAPPSSEFSPLFWHDLKAVPAFWSSGLLHPSGACGCPAARTHQAAFHLPPLLELVLLCQCPCLPSPHSLNSMPTPLGSPALSRFKKWEFPASALQGRTLCVFHNRNFLL